MKNKKPYAAIPLIAWSMTLLWCLRPCELFATGVSGSVPVGISYQGNLSQYGYPGSGTYSMDFRVYDALTAGNLLWDSGSMSVNLSSGSFSVVLNIPVSILGSGGSRYLQVSIATTTLARQQINSVPYALLAKSIEGNLDISNGGFSLSLATSTLVYVSTPNGNVGIGTTSPDQKLHILGGSIHIAGESTGVAIDDNAAFAGSPRIGLVKQYGFFGELRSAIGAPIVFSRTTASSVLDFTGTRSESMRIDGSGNVGIGTASPSQALDVVGNLKFSSALMPGGSAGSLGQVLVSQGASAAPVWQNSSSAGAAWSLTGNAGTTAGTNFLGTTDNQAVVFKSNNTEFMRITPTGNVGIGTASPLAALDILGGGYLHVSGNTNPAVTSQGAYLGWNHLSGGTGETDFINNQGLGSGGFAFFNANSAGVILSTPVVITGGGNVGIGTSSPGVLLDVNGTANFRGNGSANIGAVYMDVNGFELESFNPGNTIKKNVNINAYGGNVGIGTASPGAKLDVQGGDIRTSGGLLWNNGASLLSQDQGGAIKLGNSYLSGTVPYIDFRYGIGSAQDYNMRLINSGNGQLAIMGGSVGICTSNPAAKLDVNGNIQMEGSRMIINGFDGGNNFWFKTTASEPGSVFMAFTSAGGLANAVQLAPGNNLGVYADKSGNVGIGTGGPRTKLQIQNGDVYTSSAGNGLIVKSPSGSACARIGINDSGALTVTPVVCP